MQGFRRKKTTPRKLNLKAEYEEAVRWVKIKATECSYPNMGKILAQLSFEHFLTDTLMKNDTFLTVATMSDPMYSVRKDNIEQLLK